MSCSSRRNHRLGRPARACPADGAIRRAVAEVLGNRATDRCRMVGPREMGRTLRQHDWPADTDPNEFYGFHTDDGRILVQDARSVLHERVHDAGVDDRHVARWLCEALAEEVAEHLHRTRGFDWVPTYLEYRRVLQEQILSRLAMTGVQLAQLVAKPPRGVRADRWIVRQLVEADPGLRARGQALLRALGHAAGDEVEPFLRAVGATPRGQASRRTLRRGRRSVAREAADAATNLDTMAASAAAPLYAAVEPLLAELPSLPSPGKGQQHAVRAAKAAYRALLAQAGIEIDDAGKLWIVHVTDAGTKPPPGIESKNLRKYWGRRVGLFSDVSKMPGFSFSLPAGSTDDAGVCQVAALPALQAVCDVCYARQGRYIEPTAQRALWQRLRWVERLLAVYGPVRGALYLAAAIRWGARPRQGKKPRDAAQRRWNHFRLHDSGEFYSGAYAQLWAYTAAFLARTEPPAVRLWMPTRSWALVPEASGKRPTTPERLRAAVANHFIMGPLVAANALPNTTVRPSALSELQPAPEIPGLGPGTGVWYPHGDPRIQGHPAPGDLCIAPSQKGACWGKRECSACWHPARVVFYHRHGGVTAGGAEAEKAGRKKKSVRRKPGSLDAKARMALVRRAVQIGEPADRPRGRVSRPPVKTRPDALWMVLDPRTRQVFSRAWPSRDIAAAWARGGHLLLMNVGTGLLEDVAGRCVGEVLAIL